MKAGKVFRKTLDVFDNLMQGIKNATNKRNPKSKPLALVTIA